MNKKELVLFVLLIILLIKSSYNLGYAEGQIDILEEGLDNFIKRMLDATKTTTKDSRSISSKSGESASRNSADKERAEKQPVHAG